MAYLSASKIPKTPFSGSFQTLQDFWKRLVLDIFQFFIIACMAASVTSRQRGGVGIREMPKKTCFNRLHCSVMDNTNMSRGGLTKMFTAGRFSLQVKKLRTRSCCVTALHAFSRMRLFVVASFFQMTCTNKFWKCLMLPPGSFLQRNPKGKN